MPSLSEYRRKRDFTRTAEPSGKRSSTSKTRSKKAETSAQPTSSSRRFVIQKHDATRLHFDFRLELKGTLVSWAIPKGLPLKKGEKHLAIKVEDHPLSYREFEGNIPKGEYGGGTVQVWDQGTFKPLHRAPLKELANGKLHVVLEGSKLKGEWYLVQLKHSKEDDQWLIIRAGEDHPNLPRSLAARSVISGRTMSEIEREVPSRSASFHPQQVETSKKKAQPVNPSETSLPFDVEQFIEPMKALTREQAPSGDWTYEVKFDGYRIGAYKNGSEVHLITRNRNDLTHRFPDIADAIRALKVHQAIIDGEMVALDEQGRSSFQLLQAQEQSAPLRFYAFDLLSLENKSWLHLPLEKRRQKLQRILPAKHTLLHYSKSLGSNASLLLEKAAELGLEGIIGKRATSPYEPGQRSGSWIKLKILHQQEFVIGGYTEPSGSRAHFGALLVGVYQDGKLRCTGRVGTGFTSASLKELHQQLSQIQRTTCPFSNLPDDEPGRYGQGITMAMMKRCHWVQPKLVCQLKFTEWTRDGRLRHPVFLGLRNDKRAKEVIRESAPEQGEATDRHIESSDKRKHFASKKTKKAGTKPKTKSKAKGKVST